MPKSFLINSSKYFRKCMPKSFPKMYVQKFSDKFFKIFLKMYAQKFSDKFFKIFPKMYAQKFSDKFFKIFQKMCAQKFSNIFFKIFLKMYAQMFSGKFFKIFPKCKNFEKFNIFPKVKIQYLNNVGVKSTHPNVHTLCRGYHICLDFKPEPGQLQYCSEPSKILNLKSSNTLVCRIDMQARLLIFRKNSPLHGLIWVCMLIVF